MAHFPDPACSRAACVIKPTENRRGDAAWQHQFRDVWWRRTGARRRREGRMGLEGAGRRTGGLTLRVRASRAPQHNLFSRASAAPPAVSRAETGRRRCRRLTRSSDRAEVRLPGVEGRLSTARPWRGSRQPSARGVDTGLRRLMDRSRCGEPAGLAGDRSEKILPLQRCNSSIA